ncbi:uncharacterized protein LOC106462398 isoform X2 [Limulus polyphemus]|uniref:Uncharacterized protein LOC106462398 isoform X2 n=1 Tax=Limulus polyphemus TaxID=6850 RepID=A0ABM1SP02_LIMPO|nr:uncharacterized protein LOC106462398 isoform X2 [Limulus polyphemus]
MEIIFVLIMDKLLVKLEEHEPEVARSPEEECAICINAKATMQTFPCGHRVVCRKCFVKTIQIAVSQRVLPLRCVVCRTKILRLKQTNHGWSTPLPQAKSFESGSHQEIALLTPTNASSVNFASVSEMLKEPEGVISSSILLDKSRSNSKPPIQKYKKNKISVATNPPSTRRIPPLGLAPPGKPVTRSLKPAATKQHQPWTRDPERHLSANNVAIDDVPHLPGKVEILNVSIRPPPRHCKRQNQVSLSRSTILFPIPEHEEHELMHVKGNVNSSVRKIPAQDKPVKTYLPRRHKVSKPTCQDINSEEVTKQRGNNDPQGKACKHQNKSLKFSKPGIGQNKNQQSKIIPEKNLQRPKMDPFRFLFKAFRQKLK